CKQGARLSELLARSPFFFAPSRFRTFTNSDSRELVGVVARGRQSRSPVQSSSKGATRSGVRQARAARRGPRGVFRARLHDATGPATSLPRKSGPRRASNNPLAHELPSI